MEAQVKLIEEEMKTAYMDYAMSVIVARALPDVRDGLKPVHRRILYVMNELGLLHNKPFKKSANIVGTSLARYHPHGDSSVYDALVRMAQDFSLRYPLVDGQGNFGSIDGDSAAAYRYTEARLKKLAEELLFDIDKNTVNFVDNFDGSLKEPVVLPGKIPNLLINGSTGIAVGMATNIPPHNITEVIKATSALIDNPNLEVNDLLKIIKGPDFPTAGIIVNSDLASAYNTGRGKILVRAKTHFENKKNKQQIIITEIPYQVNKSLLIESIADLVRDKKVLGISDIKDESNKKGIRIVIELKQHTDKEVVLNSLFKYSNLQTTYGIIMLALVNNLPKILNLKQLIQEYINHRIIVVTRKTSFELEKAQSRLHIVHGLEVALKNIDEVINLIKKSEDTSKARDSLIKKYELSEIQANAILEMRLQRLTSLETKKLIQEKDVLTKLIKELKETLAKRENILAIIKKELIELEKEYSDSRRTEITQETIEIEAEDLIQERDIVITATNQGYIKQTPLTLYKQQRRGGKGIIATETKEDDFVKEIFLTSNLNTLLFFTNRGKLFQLKAYKMPASSRYSLGKALVNLLQLEKNEKVTTILPVSNFESDFLVMLTKNGIIKKTKLDEYSNLRKTGIKAISLRTNDELIDVKLSSGQNEFFIATKKGRAIHFSEDDVIAIGRTAQGVRAIKVSKDDNCVGLEIVKKEDTVLTITENGYGKRTKVEEYRITNRGGKGVTNIKTSGRNGNVVAVKSVKDGDEILIVTKKGMLTRIPVKDLSVISRNTLGFRIMKLDAKDKVTDITKFLSEDS